MTNKHEVKNGEYISDADEGEPFGFWEEKQRELITSVVDYNLNALYDLIGDSNIDLSPSYQRRDRWDDVRQSRLIESFLMNVPVPPIFLNEDTYGQYSVIDGRQRLSAINRFLSNNLKLTGLSVFSDINNKSFQQLPPRLQAVLKTRPTLRAVIILRQSDSDIKYEVFRRLNTGGVKLNAQEIRNSVYSGRLNSKLIELSENRLFHRLLGVKNVNTSKIYQEMLDVELVLRYFAFKDQWRSFQGGLVRHLDRYMDQNRNITDELIEKHSKDFLDTIEKVNTCFSTNAFRRWIPETEKWRNQIIASLYDVQMLALQSFPIKEVEENAKNIEYAFKNLFRNPDFRKAINATVPVYFVYKVAAFEDEIGRIVGGK